MKVWCFRCARTPVTINLRIGTRVFLKRTLVAKCHCRYYTDLYRCILHVWMIHFWVLNSVILWMQSKVRLSKEKQICLMSSLEFFRWLCSSQFSGRNLQRHDCKCERMFSNGFWASQFYQHEGCRDSSTRLRSMVDALCLWHWSTNHGL